MRCDKALAYEAMQDIPGIHVLDTQEAGLKLSADTPQARSAYFREYFFLEQCQRDHHLIAEIERSI